MPTVFWDASALVKPSCVLVSADQRLLRAAQAEGVQTLNPEQLSAADLPAMLSQA